MSKPARPMAVTSSCLLLGVSCFFAIGYVVTTLTDWLSLDVQEALTSFFDQVQGARFGLSTPQAIDAARVVLIVVVGVLVAGVVFAAYAAGGHLASRWGLASASVAAVLVLMFTGPIGFFFAGLSIVAVVQLWNHESRTWFAVVNGRTPPPPRPEPVRPAPARADSPAVPAVPPPAPVSVRPGPPSAVRTLDLVVSIPTAIAVLMSAPFLAIYVLGRDAFVRAMIDAPYQINDLTEADASQGLRNIAVISAVTLALGIPALVAVRLLVAGRAVGHLALVVLSAVTLVVGVFTIVGVPWAGAAVWALVLLTRSESRAWVERSRPQ